ncbi:MAG: AGE family epimerase/isomerase [Propionibacteriaceae bacterium]|nr:AGE family epimerase/isomerase [Propionibacteriaceae bacterium]
MIVVSPLNNEFATHATELLDFALGSICEEGGFGWLGAAGTVDRAQNRQLWINCRMTHVAAIGTLLGHPGCSKMLDHGVRALTDLFCDNCRTPTPVSLRNTPVSLREVAGPRRLDPEQLRSLDSASRSAPQNDVVDEFPLGSSGWFDTVDWEGNPTNDTKAAYAHAFVILAASSAVAAGSTQAVPLFEDALRVSTKFFWDEEYGMVVEEWDRSFTTCSDYRGVNANMHTVEAYLAAADVIDLLTPPSSPCAKSQGPDYAAGQLRSLDSASLGACAAEPARATRSAPQNDGLGGAPQNDRAGVWRNRALRITNRVVNQEARNNDWRIPEHFNSQWIPDLGYNEDTPADPFRPYGATIGHGLEWARLCLQLGASLDNPPEWIPEAAEALYDRALSDGWNSDGAEGFVYTTDWVGQPVVHERMHWVLAEAMGASAALTTSGVRDTTSDLESWWAYAKQHLIDPDHGSWFHELDRHNQPSALVWSGKPDIYHALQAVLIPRLPLTPAIVPALASGLLFESTLGTTA